MKNSTNRLFLLRLRLGPLSNGFAPRARFVMRIQKFSQHARPSALALTVAALLLTISVAQAQSFEIDWFTIDSGGGASTGGQYTLSGTMGQPDAGSLFGGNYTLDGGFWGITAAVQTPDAPLLSVGQLNNTVVVYWPLPATGFVLDQTTALSSTSAGTSWTQVPFPYQTNATHILVTVPSPSGQKFYRLRKP